MLTEVGIHVWVLDPPHLQEKKEYYDMGQTTLPPLRKKACYRFLSPLNGIRP
jgi:hypothetical protein